MTKFLFGLAVVGLFMFGQSDAQAYHRYGHHSHSYNHYKHKSQPSKLVLAY